MIRIAFDTGGTFTDFVLYDDGTHNSVFLKLPSTPDNPARCVLDGLAQLLGKAGIGAGEVGGILHATTVATNAIIQRNGAPTALITTKGFRDVLVIGRQKRPETYDLYMDKPAPLVPRRAAFEVPERIAFDGAVLEPLSQPALDAVIDRILDGEFAAVAVSLLHAYANPDHEIAIRARLAERAPGLAVSLSSEVSPKYREYERTNTTVANSYLKPIVDAYVGHLQGALGAGGFEPELFIMQSNGGLVTPDFARQYPIRIVESGPAAGVLMAGIVGAAAGEDRIVSFDMGGTTAKLGAIDHGVPAIMPSFEVAATSHRPGSGLPISLPAVELLEIGAGGGSIVKTEMGTIQVGPESAGAAPGPVSYGQGGRRPTLTDANLALGYLNPENFNNGAMRLDRDAAERAIAETIAAPLGLPMIEAAWGVHLVANNNMEHALRLVSVERGRDPRAYAMVAFGGAGPLHAAAMARTIGIPKVIVPHGAGVGSAIGLLQADAKIDVSITRLLRLDAAATGPIGELYVDLRFRAEAILDRLGLPGEILWERFGYMRFAGQGYEIRVPLPAEPIDATYVDRAKAAFIEAYGRIHPYCDPTIAIEAVDWCLEATIPTAKGGGGDLFGGSPAAAGGRPAGRRAAYFAEAGGRVETPVFNRANLTIDQPIPGPAIIEDPDCTTVVPPGDTVARSAAGHLIIAIGQGTSP